MKEEFDLVIGMGTTGLSVVRFLQQQGRSVRVLDTRDKAPAIDFFKESFPGLPVKTGGWESSWLEQATRIVVSPGISVKASPLSEIVRAEPLRVLGDIQLFAEHVDAPVAAITGSNAKTTVTTLLNLCAQAAGKKSVACGNIGMPALDALQESADVYVLELSSFQLETTHALSTAVGCILNVSEDHMDRYQGMEDYTQAKQRVYKGASVAVWNRDDERTRPRVEVKHALTFGLHAEADYRLDLHSGDLIAHSQLIGNVSDLAVSGMHNALNALAVLAMCEALGIDRDVAFNTIRQFPGLPHRCQKIAEHQGITWVNDSKGTNVGATIAALNGIGAELDANAVKNAPADAGKIILLAGGVGKGQQFGPLKEPVSRYVREVVLYGIDAQVIATEIEGASQITCVSSLEQAVRHARDIAHPGDAVVLSPACASFDQFSGYEERGDRFVRLVNTEVLHD